MTVSSLQDFLESSSSQLTHHGLASLREGLRPNELAVFFRNNHFNTIFLHKGVVHILVTDQGYEFEKVWLLSWTPEFSMSACWHPFAQDHLDFGHACLCGNKAHGIKGRCRHSFFAVPLLEHS